MNSADREFYIVIAVMIVLFIFACAAVAVFIRVWRKEKSSKQ